MPKIKQYIYYPIIRKIYKDLKPKPNWVAIHTFENCNTRRKQVIYDCLKSSFNNDASGYQKLVMFLETNSNHFIRLSDIVFCSEEREPLLIVFDDENNHYELLGESVKAFDFTEIASEISANFPMPEDIINDNEQRLLVKKKLVGV